MLAAGYKLGPTVDHDTHNTNFGRNTQGRTVVLANNLSREDVTEAYRAMRFYASEAWNIQVDFTIKNKPMGSILNSRLNPIIRVSINDPDEDDKVKHIKVMFEKASSKEPSTALASVVDEEYIVAEHKSARIGETWYYYIEILQKDRHSIITSPIWVKRTR